MPAIENSSGFAAQVFGVLDAQAREHLVLVVSATFEARPGRPPAAADEQLEIGSVDRHRGDPATTSIEYPSQLAYGKPATDVILTGHACAPRGRAVETMMIGVRVADVTKSILVSGARFWRPGVGGHVPSSPRPFERLPVIYERAFGGGAVPPTGASGGSAYDARNPIGVGVPGTRPSDPTVDTELPNFEYASERMDKGERRPRPAGFGAIAPGWQPRVAFAGTYDETWLAEQAPLLPLDFNTRFFQVAPVDQQSRTVKAGDLVEVVGMTPEGRWTFTLPPFEVPVSLVHHDRVDRSVPVLDTIHLEPDRYRVHLIGRVVVPVVRNRAPLAQIIVGHPRRGWLRAHHAGKVYRADKGGTQ